LLGLLALSPACAGMTPEEVKAFEGYKAKAEKGGRVAQYNLGVCYAKGEGVPKDEMQAVSWYRKAAEQGDAGAQICMGYAYELGDGVAKDMIEAYAYFNLASITDEYARKSRDVLEKKLSPEAALGGQQRTKEMQKEFDAKIEAKKAGK